MGTLKIGVKSATIRTKRSSYIILIAIFIFLRTFSLTIKFIRN